MEERITKRALRETFEGVLRRVRSEKTANRYLRQFALMERAGLSFEQWCRGGHLSKQQYYFCKASEQYGLAVAGLDAVAKRNWPLARDHAERIQACRPNYEGTRTPKKLDSSVSPFELMPETDIGRNKLNKISVVHAGTPRQRRKTISKLPMDWRDLVQVALPQEYALAGLISSLTGLRPSELGKEVKVTAISSRLTVEIRGAKTNQGHGQAKRKITFDVRPEVATPLAKQLYNIVRASNNFKVKVEDVEAWRRKFRAAAKAALGRGFGPYSYRYQMSADLKSAGYSKVQIAQVLGHVSDRTQNYYGLARQGGGIRDKILEVVTSSKVREHPERDAGYRLADRIPALAEREEAIGPNQYSIEWR